MIKFKIFYFLFLLFVFLGGCTQQGEVLNIKRASSDKVEKKIEKKEVSEVDKIKKMFTIDKKAKNLSMVLMAVGLIALIFGFVSNPHGAWPALLFNTYFYLGISVFAVFFVV